MASPRGVAPRLSARAAPAPASLHFTAAGDFGASAQTRALLNGIQAAGPDLTSRWATFLWRDRHRRAWCDYVKSRVGATYPFELITGNHESNGLDGNIDAFAACLPNQLPGLVGTYGSSGTSMCPPPTRSRGS